MMVDLRGRRLGPSLTKIFVSIAIIFVLSHAAFGHARLVQSQPKANENLTTLPQVIELWFSESLESGLNTIEVTDDNGKRVDNGDVRLADGNKKATVNLLQLAPGRYTVRWRALSADQHPMRGTFTFTIAQSAVATAPTSRPAQTVTPSPMPHAEMPGSTSGDTISWSQTLVRWLSYVGMLVLFGGFAFKLLVLIPALRNASGATENQLLIVGSKRILACNWIGGILLLVTSILALILQASEVLAGSYNTWAHIPQPSALWLTPYGRTLALKLFLVLLMLSLGAVNNYHYGKRASRLANKRHPDTSSRLLEGSFLRSLSSEAALGIVVLLVTAVLVFLTPARNHPAMDQGAATAGNR